MELNEIYYALPRSLIAPHPSEDRAGSRLMVLERLTGKISHTGFASLGDVLSPGDLLVLNDSRVLPVRLLGRKETGGEGRGPSPGTFPEPEQSVDCTD